MDNKYTSVDILFHFDVDATSPQDARKQADEQFRRGAVGVNICNRKGQATTLETSILEETLNNLRTKSEVVQELAEVTNMPIYDNNSLERAIKEILPSTREERLKEIKKLYEESDDISYKMGIEAVLDILELYNAL